MLCSQINIVPSSQLAIPAGLLTFGQKWRKGNKSLYNLRHSKPEEKSLDKDIS